MKVCVIGRQTCLTVYVVYTFTIERNRYCIKNNSSGKMSILLTASHSIKQVPVSDDVQS